MKMRLLLTTFITCFHFFVQVAGNAPTVYFQAGAHYNEAFVFPMTNSNHIVSARAELQKPANERRWVGARVAPGADGINRNLVVPGKPLWNWHITEFGGFGDSTIMQGFPSWIEADPYNPFNSVTSCCRLDKELSIAEIFYINASVSNGVFQLR